MVGGRVIETVTVDCDRRWINCQDRNYPKMTCAINIVRTTAGDAVAEGDQLWWQGNFAFHTPKKKHIEDPDDMLRAGVDYDIEIPRVGFSGVSIPAVIS